MELNLLNLLKKKRLHLSLAILVTVLSACSENDNNQPRASVESIPARHSMQFTQPAKGSGETPKLDRSQGIQGPDTDDNGIRDDIDDYVEIQYSNHNEMSAVAQAARANQAVLSVDLSDQTETRQVNRQISHATACVYRVFGSSEASATPAIVSRDLEALTFNTADRLNRYRAFNKALDGTSWSLPAAGGRELCQLNAKGRALP